jgi:tetratricopeptide (TPR) repeat protein
MNKFKEAKNSFQKAIELKPDYKDALICRGQILLDEGELELSLKDFDTCNSEDSRARALAALYRLGRIDEIYQRIKKNLKLDAENLKISAFSSFIISKQKKDTGHNFCKNPLDFLYSSNISSHLKDSNFFINEIILELRKNVKLRWEAFGKTTRKGFHSGGKIDLFKNPPKNICKLQSIILDELELYYSKFKDQSCSYIKKWPLEKKIKGWHVILKKQGYQVPHMHASGWLSGIIYLKVVPSLKKNEGAIEFSLNGDYFFDINSPKKMFEPKIGDIVFFPSSLHHRTIPFSTDSDRMVIAFDLAPNKS